MKIAITGSHGVGKSTLAEFLRRKLEEKSLDSIIMPEVPRLICESIKDKEYFRRKNNSLPKQLLLLIGQLVIENHERNTSNIQICDRSLFDHWAYTLNLFEKEIKKQNLTDIYDFFISKYCNSYDFIFYIPNEIPPIDDEIREADLTFQSNIDKMIVALMDKYKINYITITGTVEHRCNLIFQTLNL